VTTLTTASKTPLAKIASGVLHIIPSAQWFNGYSVTKGKLMGIYIKSTLILLLSLILSGCGPGQLFGPTLTPSPTITNTPTLTTTPTFTSTVTPTFTPTFTYTPTPTSTFTPSITPTFTPTPVIAIVSSSSANIRYGPGADYPIVTKLLKDTEVVVVGYGLDATWIVINLPNDVQGWVSADLISMQSDITALQEIPIPPTPILYKVTMFNNISASTSRLIGVKGPFGTAVLDSYQEASFSVPQGEYTFTICYPTSSSSFSVTFTWYGVANVFSSDILDADCKDPVKVLVNEDMQLDLKDLIP